MAAIITTQSARNASNVRPIVPGPMPIPFAWSTVTIQASAASAHSASHHGRSCFSGTPSDGAFAASVSALVLEVGHEAVRARVLDVPVTVVADVAGLGLRHGLRDRAEQRVRDDRSRSRRPSPLAPRADMVRTPATSARSEPFVPVERDRGGRHAGDLADQRAERREVAAGAAGEDRAHRLRLLRGRAVVEVQRQLPAAVGHLLRRVDRQDGVQAREVDAVLVALRDVPGEHDVAGILVRRLQPDARAAHVTRAGLEVVTLDREAHAKTPFVDAVGSPRPDAERPYPRGAQSANVGRLDGC